jgi:hypothetical protein
MLKCTMYVGLPGADCNSTVCSCKITVSCEVVVTDAHKNTEIVETGSTCHNYRELINHSSKRNCGINRIE